MSPPKHTKDWEASTPDDSFTHDEPKHSVDMTRSGGSRTPLMLLSTLTSHIPFIDTASHPHDTANVPFKIGADVAQSAWIFGKGIKEVKIIDSSKLDFEGKSSVSFLLMKRLQFANEENQLSFQ